MQTLDTNDQRVQGQPTISRAGLVRAARLTIKDVRASGVEVPTGLVRRIMRVARTAEKITVGWFSVDRSCGCLVGTLHLAEGDWRLWRLSKAEYEIGVRFVDRLRDVLSGEGQDLDDVVQVVE